MYPTDLTVAAVIEKDGQYLLVEERAMGKIVFSQPGGHIEAEESPEEAVVREALEETGCTVRCGDLIGVYLWIHPQSRQQFLRIIYVAEYLDHNENLPLDQGIIRPHWMSRDEMHDRRHSMRTPVVLRALQDYEAGRRQSDGLLTGMLPLQQNVLEVLANADLV